MFKKRKSKRSYYARLMENGDVYYREKSVDISSDAVLSSIQRLFESEGKIVVEHIDEETISVTSLKSNEDDKIENRLTEIKKMIRDSLDRQLSHDTST